MIGAGVYIFAWNPEAEAQGSHTIEGELYHNYKAAYWLNLIDRHAPLGPML